MKVKATTKDAARLMMEGVQAMAELENAGIRVDTGYLDSQIVSVTDQIRDMVKELKGAKEYRLWRKKYGDKTQLGNKEQLGSIVFDEMGFKRKKGAAKKKRNDDGDDGRHEAKNDEAAFSHVDLPFVKLYFRKEKYKKLLGTYLKGIKRETQDGFLHPFFDLHKVVTSRSSSSRPNFQNIPARNREIMEIIRRCFIPRKGRHLVEIDYSGVEVRVSACYNKDRQLIKYIEDPTTDMHRDMAMRLFMLEKDQIEKKTTRDWAKNRWVFPQFYGSVFFQCAPHLWQAVTDGHKLPNGMTVMEHLGKQGIRELGGCEPDDEPKKGTFVYHCKEVENYMWNEVFHEFTAWKKKWYAQYLKTGYIDSLVGFRMEGLFSRNDVLNYAIQGSAFHCLLQTVIWVLKEIRKRKMKTLVVAQIHDSMLLDVTANELEVVLQMVPDIMSNRLRREWDWIIVPLDVEAEITQINRPWNEKEAVKLK